jgi:hypothetical protein
MPAESSFICSCHSMIGVGYRAAVSGDTLVLNLGYSHPVEMAVPKGLEVSGAVSISCHSNPACLETKRCPGAFPPSRQHVPLKAACICPVAHRSRWKRTRQSWSRVATRSWWGSSLQTSAPSVSPSPTRARVCGMWTRWCCARKASEGSDVNLIMHCIAFIYRLSSL